MILLMNICIIISDTFAEFIGIDDIVFENEISLDKARRNLKVKYSLNLQYCYDSGEAYSASYLISKEHLLHQFTNQNLSWVNCEMVSDYYHSLRNRITS